MIVKQTCERCHDNSPSHVMSMFNTDMICMKCKKKEKKHPDYDRAKEAEHQAVVNGDYNFKGVGKPNDL